jgi:hypothetical protein
VLAYFRLRVPLTITASMLCRLATGFFRHHVDDLVGGRWRAVDAGAEVGHQDELGYLAALVFERDGEARQA